MYLSLYYSYKTNGTVPGVENPQIFEKIFDDDYYEIYRVNFN